MTIIEIVASILGLVSVWLLTNQNLWCWPTGIAMVLLYIVIFYKEKLYSDMLLQVFFVGMQIYGWYLWSVGKQFKKDLKVTFLDRKDKILWTLVLIFFSLILGYIMNKFTDADLPFIDSTTTVISIIAQWLMTKKIVESWILWILADIIYVMMYFYKELYPTAILYLFF